MNITPYQTGNSYKQGSLVNVTVEQINKALGFIFNMKDDPYKVKYSWGFKAQWAGPAANNGAECAIWDWKGSGDMGSFSFYGPQEVLIQLFGAEHVTSR